MTLVTNYFDKLIQVPIRVPPLGTQEVRAYLMLLFVENSDIGEDDRETIRARVCEQLGQTWQGKRVDRAFISSLGINASRPISSAGSTRPSGSRRSWPPRPGFVEIHV